MDEKIKVSCEMEITLKMIGGKCKPLILNILIHNDAKRFTELLKEITQVSQKTLTNQLKELQADGLIKREAFAEVPLRVEYSITEKGKTLLPILDMMCDWGEANIDERFELTSPQCAE